MRTEKVKATDEIKLKLVENEKAYLEKQRDDKIAVINDQLTKKKAVIEKQAEDAINELNNKYKILIDELPAKHEYMIVELPEYNEEPKKKKGSRKEWTDKDKQQLINLYQHGLKNPQIGKELKRSKGSIDQQVQKLKEDPKYMSQIYRDTDLEKMNKQETDFNKIPEFGGDKKKKK